MRRLLLTLFAALILVIGTIGVAPAMQAQAGANATDAANTANNLAAGANDTAAKTPITPEASADDAYNGVMARIMSLFAWLVGVAAITLDNTVYYTVVKMGLYVKDLTAVGVAWRILRDLGNIALIFGFLAIGISIIIGTEVYGWGQKLLPRLLMAAVALNFSLFITEAIIDGGNLFATQFYTQINGGTQAGAKNFDINSAVNDGIAGKIMYQLGLQKLYGDAVNSGKALFTGGNPWYIGFMGILLFITTAFVMFSLAFILIARFVALIFIIILAPIGVVGFAVPPLENIGKQWREQLINQTITAPVLLLMLYVALIIITDKNFLTGFGKTPDWLGFVPNGSGVLNLTGLAGALLSFLVAMGLLLAVTMYAKTLGAAGAAMATKTAGRVVGGFAGYGLAGGASLAGRSTLGLLGRGLNNQRMQARAAGGGVGGTFARLGAFAGRNLEKRTYDIRNVKTLGALGGGISGVLANAGGFGDTGFGSVAAGTGKGATVTAKQAVDKTIEGYKTYKPFTGDWWREQQKEYEKAADVQKRKSTLAAAALPTVPPNTASINTQKELKKMSVDELVKLKDIRDGINTLVHNLSPEKFNELMKSDKLLAAEKGKLKGTWETQFDAINVATTMNRLSTEEIAALGGETLLRIDPLTGGRPVVDTLGVAEFDAVRRKGNLSKQERHDIHAHMMVAPLGSALKAQVDDYFLAANDPGGNRKKYWDV